MKRLHAYTIVEILAAIGVIVPVLLLAVVCCHAAWVGAKDRKNAMQLREIMVTFTMWADANSHVGDLPGAYTSDPPPAGWPQNATDPSVVGRFWALIAAPGIDPLDPKKLVNPIAGVPEKVWSNPNCTTQPGVTSARTAGFGSNNMSYALLSITARGEDVIREWHNNFNAGCPMICDRNRGTSVAPKSSWSKTGWQGNVVWGDTMVTFENSPKNLNETLYGNKCPINNLWGPATTSNAGMVNPGD